MSACGFFRFFDEAKGKGHGCEDLLREGVLRGPGRLQWKSVFQESMGSFGRGRARKNGDALVPGRLPGSLYQESTREPPREPAREPTRESTRNLPGGY